MILNVYPLENWLSVTHLNEEATYKPLDCIGKNDRFESIETIYLLTFNLDHAYDQKNGIFRMIGPITVLYANVSFD